MNQYHLLNKVQLSKTEQQILEKIYSGDRSSFAYIYKHYFNALCTYASNYIEEKEDCKNIVQDIIIKLWENRAGARDINSLRSYLFGSVHNQCLNHLKHKRIVEKHQAEVTYTLLELSLETTDFLESNEEITIIMQAIENLPEQTKKVFRMKRFDDMSYKEIAEKLQISDRTVDTHMTKAMRLLKEKLNHLLMVTILLHHFFHLVTTGFYKLSLLG